MVGYFKPLRRKIGVVVMLVACAAMGGWIRGKYVEDLYLPGSGHGQSEHAFLFSGAGMTWYWDVTDGGFEWEPGWHFYGFTRKPFDPLDRITDPNIEPAVIDSRRQWFGFDYGTSHVRDEPTDRTTWLLIPYWSIVVPLTMVSAWLLFGGRHRSAGCVSRLGREELLSARHS